MIKETTPTRTQVIADVANVHQVDHTQVRDTYDILRTRGIIRDSEDMDLLNAAVQIQQEIGLTHYRSPRRMQPIIDHVKDLRDERDALRKESAPGSAS